MGKSENVNRQSFHFNFLKRIIFRVDFQGVLPNEMEEILKLAKPIVRNFGFLKFSERNANQVNIEVPVDNQKEVLPRAEIKESLKVYSFVNESSGFMLDLSTKFICLNISSTKYINFEIYRDIILSIIELYNKNVDFFTIKRTGLRKINICCVTSKENINLFFNKDFFNYLDILEDSTQYSSHNSYSFSNGDIKVNLNTFIKEGFIESEQLVYQLTLDSDAYIDDIENDQKGVFPKEKLDSMNDRLFNLYLKSLTQKMIQKLQYEDTDFISDGFIGIEPND